MHLLIHLYFHICLGYIELKFIVSRWYVSFDTYFSIKNIIFLTNSIDTLYYSSETQFPFCIHFSNCWYIFWLVWSLWFLLLLTLPHANIFYAVISVFLSEFNMMTLHCQTPIPQNIFCWMFLSSWMCHAIE